MDLSKAFDTIPHVFHIAKMKSYRLSDTCCKLLKDYLSSRTQRVKIGDRFSNWKEIKRGVPQGSLLFFINDLFFHIKSVKLNAYADDEQLYDSNNDPAELAKRILHELNTANMWYTNNGMIVNPDKHEAMVLGKTDYKFSFLVENSIELLGMTLDDEMSIREHLATTCKKINNQFSVMTRFGKLLSSDTLIRLYKAFILEIQKNLRLRKTRETTSAF